VRRTGKLSAKKGREAGNAHEREFSRSKAGGRGGKGKCQRKKFLFGKGARWGLRGGTRAQFSQRRKKKGETVAGFQIA